MRIGIDFDNTIVCYDELFHRIALEQGLIPVDIPKTKSSVRDYLRQINREEDWTQLQGYVYGSRMDEAPAFPGVFDFFSLCRASNVELYIISHKTKRPFQGPLYDLHEVGYRWLEQQGLLAADGSGIARGAVYFELTKQEKLQRIKTSGCEYFIDDLPEFLAEPQFPPAVERILFDPGNLYTGEQKLRRAASWADINRLLFD